MTSSSGGAVARWTSLGSAAIPALALAFLWPWSCQQTLEAPAPHAALSADSIPPVIPTVLQLPLTFDARPSLAVIEDLVPRSFGDIDTPDTSKADARLRYAFAADRDSLIISIDRQTVYLTTFIRYKGKGWYSVSPLPDVTGSCGMKGPPPRLRIQISTEVEIKPDWKLESHTKVLRVEPYSNDVRDHCRVTAFNVDMTDKITAGVRELVERQASAVDAHIEAADVRTWISGLWHEIGSPIRLADSVWLSINPSAVRIGNVVAHGTSLVAQLGLTAVPRIVTGAQPDTTVPILPALGAGVKGDRLHIDMIAELDYARASAMLQKAVRGKRIVRDTHTLEVLDATVAGLGDGRVVVGLSFRATTARTFAGRGTTTGRVYFVGTPVYDPANDQIVVPDLDYDVASANMLVNSVEWIKHADVREFFRANAHWPVGGLMTRARQLLAKGLNRDLGPSAHLSARVVSAEAIGVEATARAVVFRARAEAEAQLAIHWVPPPTTAATALP
ncbi:MAG: DUF4403 family protein [Gemmatimonadota bacterium]